MELADAPRFGEEPQRGWFRRNALWFVPTVILVPLLLCGGCCSGIFYFVVSSLKESPPYQMALDHLRKSPEVIKILGEPVEDATRWPKGEIKMQGAKGSAQFQFRIAGPRGEADAYAVAVSDVGEWKLTRLRVVFNDGQTLEVVPDQPEMPVLKDR